MNTISKELRHQIASKVSNALKQKDDDSLEKAILQYKGRTEKILKLYRQYKQEYDSLEEELRLKDFEVHHRENNESCEIQKRFDRIDQDEIVSKIVVQLQYSKEPDFLKLIDALIEKEIPKKVLV